MIVKNGNVQNAEKLHISDGMPLLKKDEANNMIRALSPAFQKKGEKDFGGKMTKKERNFLKVSSETPCYVESEDIELAHRNTLIVATNTAEFAYIIEWCIINELPCPYMGKEPPFPIALSTSGGGWVDRMDRAVYYVRFVDFVARVT